MRQLLAAAALLAAVLAAVAARDRPPAPRPADAPAAEFSAVRAQAFLRRFLGDGAPRPVGSAANARGVARVEEALRALGYAPGTQEAFDCGLYARCARVRNVVARLDGRTEGRAVLVVAHHDSVAAGPGAADDGAGVAALVEVARALRAGPPPPRPVLLLVDDGEEGGLIGANAFARRHPWAGQVGAVVNLEARGTSGPSLMFETSGPSAGFARLLRELPRPRASSLFAAVYALLPNDTDLTVFARRGVPGMNFAFIGGAARYHTSGDDLAHLDLASLQHQGENALAAVRALARSDLERPPRGDAVFFDVLGLAVVAWPLPAALPLALVASLAAGATAALLWRRRRVTLRAIAWGAVAFLGAPVAAACLGLGLRAAAVGVGLEAGLYAAQPPAFIAATWVAGLAGALAIAWASSGRSAAAGAWVGVALGWSALSVFASAALPAASHLFTVPALAAAAAGLPLALGPAGGSAATATPALPPTRAPALVPALVTAGAASLVAFPVAWLLPSAVGSLAAPVSAALVALVAASLSPLLAAASGRARRRVALLAGGALVAAAAAAIVAFRTSSDERRIAIAFHEEAGAARWLVETDADSPPAAMLRLAPFVRAPGPLLPGSAGPGFVAPAPPLGLPPPALTVLERRTLPGGRSRIRARLASARGAPAVALALPASAQATAMAVGGVPIAEPRRRFQRFLGGWQLLGCLTTPPEGVEVQLEWASDGPVEAVLLDRAVGLPASGAALDRARGRGSLGAGDFTVASARVDLSLLLPVQRQ